MNRNEFLNRLREELENDLKEQEIQDNIHYYRMYIEEEVRKGRREEDVVDELGDPWVIAKTIIDSPNANKGYASSDTGYVQEEQQDVKYDNKIHVFGFDTWWKKLLAILAVVMVIVCIITIITGIVTAVLPLVLPVLFIVLIIKLFSGDKK